VVSTWRNSCGVPLNRLAGSPAAFDGCRVFTQGFLHLEVASSALYFDERAFESKLTLNALTLEVAPHMRDEEAVAAASDRYASVAGLFSAPVLGCPGQPQGIGTMRVDEVFVFEGGVALHREPAADDHDGKWRLDSESARTPWWAP